MTDRTRNRDEESQADVAERHLPAAPPSSEGDKGGTPKVNESGVPEIVPADGSTPPKNTHQQKADRADTSEE